MTEVVKKKKIIFRKDQNAILPISGKTLIRIKVDQMNSYQIKAGL